MYVHLLSMSCMSCGADTHTYAYTLALHELWCRHTYMCLQTCTACACMSCGVDTHPYAYTPAQPVLHELCNSDLVLLMRACCTSLVKTNCVHSLIISNAVALVYNAGPRVWLTVTCLYCTSIPKMHTVLRTQPVCLHLQAVRLYNVLQSNLLQMSAHC